MVLERLIFVWFVWFVRLVFVEFVELGHLDSYLFLKFSSIIEDLAGLFIVIELFSIGLNLGFYEFMKV
jgi:hypothetical protein